GKCDGDGLFEDDQDNSGGETELPEIDPGAEDRELKNHLLKKYSGYLGSLKQELSKKKKKGWDHDATRKWEMEDLVSFGCALENGLWFEAERSKH
ncbi:hypothetical protein IFM89_037631, partial [Coptis chinensis]